MTQCNQKMKVKAVMTIFGRSLTSGDLSVHFSTFSGIIFTVGTRCRLRFAATFLFWTYCISQGIIRVCPFANPLIGPWLKFEPGAIEQFWPNDEPFTDVWEMTYFCTATCSFLAIYRLMEANFQQYSCWVAGFIFQPVVLRVCGEPRSSGVVHVLHNWFFLGTITLLARCSREV